MTINEELKNARNQLGYTLRYVSSQTGVTKSTRFKIVTGKIDGGYKKIECLQAFYNKELEEKASKDAS